MCWSDVTDLEEFIVAAAPFAGPIAVTKNPSTMSVFRSSGAGAADTLTIFSGSGMMLGHAALERHEGRLLGLHWNGAEQCVVIYEDGAVDM